MSDFDATALRDLDHQLALETLQHTADGVRNSPQDIEILIEAYEEGLRDYERQRIMIIDEQRRPAIPGAWPENEDPKQKLVRSYEGCKSRHDALSATHPRLLAEAKHVDGQLSRGVSVWQPYLEMYPDFWDECKGVIESLNSKTLPLSPRPPSPEVAMSPPASTPTLLDAYSADTSASSSRSPRIERLRTTESRMTQHTRQQLSSEVHGREEITLNITATLTSSARPSTVQVVVQGGITFHGGSPSSGRSVADPVSTTQETVRSSRGATQGSGNSPLGERGEDDGWASDSTLHD